MAETSSSRKSAETLIAELALARKGLSHTAASLALRANPALRLRASIRANSFTWLVAAALSGVALAKIPFSGRRRPKKTGGAQVVETAGKFALLPVLLGALKFAFPLLRPALSAFVADRLGRLAQNIQESTSPK